MWLMIGNGQCARYNRTLHGRLKTLLSWEKEPMVRLFSWDDIHPQCNPSCNNGFDTLLSYICGRNSRVIIDLLLKSDENRESVDSWIPDHRKKMLEIIKLASENLKKKNPRNQERWLQCWHFRGCSLHKIYSFAEKSRIWQKKSFKGIGI